jgi:hypothetical protein
MRVKLKQEHLYITKSQIQLWQGAYWPWAVQYQRQPEAIWDML